MFVLTSRAGFEEEVDEEPWKFPIFSCCSRNGWSRLDQLVTNRNGTVQIGQRRAGKLSRKLHFSKPVSATCGDEINVRQQSIKIYEAVVSAVTACIHRCFIRKSTSWSAPWRLLDVPHRFVKLAHLAKMYLQTTCARHALQKSRLSSVPSVEPLRRQKRLFR